MGFRRVQIICFFALFVIHSSSGEKCSPSTCFSSNKTPTYSPKTGQQYTYDFESLAIAQLLNKESVETSVGIRGQAIISVGDNCGYTLQLQNVIASGADNAKQQIKDFTTYPVQFTLSGDELLPEICAEDKDSIFSLNLKRGLISAFQQSISKSSEIDIFGQCPVTSYSSTNGGITTITRQRELDKCAYREKIVNGLLQGVASESSAVKSTPLLNGKVDSDAKFQDGILQSVEIREFYNYLPFSTQDHGAKAKVNTKLTLKKTATGSGNALKVGIQRSILFSNTNENLASTKVKDSIKSAFDKALKEFVGNSGKISSSSATAFADLVRLLRLAKRGDLTMSYQTMKTNQLSQLQSANKDLSRALFLDALFRVGTGDSVAALVDLSKKEFDDKEKNLMYLSFNLVTSVTKEAITALTQLFKDNLPKEAYLSIGSVVNKYCRERGCENTDIKPIADKFIAKIPKDCVTKTKKDEEHLVSVLKGIRNSQTILNSALNNIIACINTQRPSRVRVAALQAFTANPCNKKLQTSAITIMKDRQEDSEIRIEAYLTATECPNGNLANEIQAMLDSETINQVGSFVNSHLDSVKASTDPKRENARHHFRNLRTSKKFPFDPRRYSFNREISYALDSLGLGSSIDTSFIYSQRSFLPRSIRLNVTGNVFGNSFNFFELSARQENLESVIEHYFGPQGIFSRLSQQELYDGIKKEFSNRQKRAILQDLAQFDKSVKLSHEYNREPDVDVSMKVFGNELYFLSMSQNLPSTPSEFIKFMAQELQKGVDALKDFNYNFENHALWLDSEIVYPTALGLPFKLTATGASAVKVDLSGTIDIKKILENPLDSKVAVKFSPAANVFLSGTIGFTAYAYESGIEVAGTVYTNTGADTSIELEGGQKFTVKSVPTLHNQYVAEFRHQIATVTQESGREAVKVPVVFKGSDQGSEACFDQVEFLTGAAYCFDTEATPASKPGENSLWPLYGSSTTRLRMEMADSITFRAELDLNETPTITFYHDTPKDGKKRQTVVKLLSSFKPTHYYAGFSLHAPITQDNTFEAEARIGLVNEANEKKLYAFGNYQKQKYEYELGFKKSGNDITPILKLNTDLTYISGKVVEKQTPKGVSYVLQTIRFGKDDYQTTVDGSVSIEGPKFATNLKIDVGGKKIDFDGQVGYDNGKLDTDITMKSAQISTANGKVKYALTYGDKNFGNNLLIIWDKDLNSKVNRVEWSQFADWKGENCKVKNELSVGKFNANGKLNGEFGKKVFLLDSGVNYQKSSGELKIENKYSQKQPHDYDTSIYAMANKKSIKIEMSRDIEGDSSKIKNKLELSTGLKIEINGKVSHKIESRDADISIQGTFLPAPKKDITKLTYILKNTQKDHDSSLKIVVGKNELASLESKLNYGQNVKGTMKGSITDVLNIDGTYESNKGKGNAVFNAVLKDKKLRSETQFTIQKPTYNFASDFYYDYEKNNNKKVHLSTANQLTSKTVDSKNVVEIFGEHYSFDVGATNEGGFPDGKQTANVDLQLPTGRKFSASVNRDVKMKDGKGNGRLHLTATDELPNKQQRQLVTDMKVDDLNIKQSFFDFVGAMKYKDYDNKDIKAQVALKNLQKGQFSTAVGNMNIDGSLMPNTFTMNVKLDEYCADHAIYNFNGKYGNIGDIDLSGKFYNANKERPYSHEFIGTINVPETKWKSLTLKSNGKVNEPADENGVYGISYTGSIEYLSHKIQLDTELNFSKTKGTGSAKLQLPKQPPMSADFKFNCNHKDSGDVQATVNYGDKKLTTSMKTQIPDEKSFNVQASLQGDLEKFKDLSLNLEVKRPQESQLGAKLTGKVDGQNYAMDYEHRASTEEPKLVITITCPKGYVSKIAAEAQIVSALKGKGNLVIERLRDFDFIANLDGDLTSMENFFIKGDINCPKLNIEKYEFDVHSKNAGGRNGIEYKVTRNGQHVVSGTSDFATKNDKGKTIIEGKSSIKLTDGKSDDVTFKLIRNVYERSRDGEVGFGGIGTVTIGARNYAGEVKITDKEFHSKYSGCTKKNIQCTSFEAKSLLEQQSIEGFKHNLIVSVDLRQIGFPHEFGLKADTNREGIKFSHSLDAYLQSKDKPDYRYSVLINPKEASVSLTMPKREVALDAVYKYPERFYGVYESTVTFYIDKRNKPQMKSEVGFKGEIKHTGANQMIGKGDFKFSHPNVKPLRVGGEFALNADTTDANGKLEFDVFTNPMDMIVVSGKYGNTDTSGRGFNISSELEISSKGLDFNAKIHEHVGLSWERKLVTFGSEMTLPLKEFKFGVHAAAASTNFEVSAVALNEEILKANAVYDMEKHDVSLEGIFRYLKSEPFTTKAKINGLTEGSITITKGNLLNIDGGYTIGKDLHLIVKASGKEVFNSKVALNTAHFLKTDYKVDDAQVKAFSTQIEKEIKTDFDNAATEFKKHLEDAKTYGTQKGQNLVKALPDFANFRQQYSEELTALKKELNDDTNIKKLVEIVGPIIDDISKYFEQIMTIISQQIQIIQESLRQLCDEINKSLNERILPELKKFYDTLQALLSELIGQGTKIVTAVFERAAKALKVFEEDYNKISQSFKEITGGTFEAISTYVKEVINEFKELYHEIREQMKTLPGLEFIKEKYNELFGGFTPLQAITAVIEEIISTIMEVAPEQAKPFFNKLNDYLHKKFNNEEVDDVKFVKEIYELLLRALQAVKSEYIDSFSASSSLPFSLDAVKRFPPFLTNLRLSALNQLTSEPIISLKDLLYLYRPYAFRPTELLPPFTMHGEIADGSHIFTFDGRHLTFPGECAYILARDFVEGNFSIVSNMKGGKLQSIIVNDKNGFIEVNSDTILKFKDKETEFPVHDKTLHAWRNYHTFNILTEYGTNVLCSVDLTICHFEVSGYYLGKIRGLLGNGNGEAYDDYILPDGKITENTAELGNAYKTQKNCASVSKSGDSHPKSHSNDFCAEYFGRDSSLRLGFVFADPTNYREACEHATHGSKNPQVEACKIASIYASRLRQEFIPVSIPKACNQCILGAQKVDIGDEVSVKTPQKQADIVVVFDTAIGGGLTVVTEIMNEVRKELKTQGINDVQVIAIGYNANDRYSSIYTTKGKLDFKGKFESLKGTGIPEEETIKTGNKEVDEFVAELEKVEKVAKEDLSISPDARAFQKALSYPFRPTATKTIFAVRSNGIPYSINPSKLASGQLSIELTSKAGIQVHSLMPVEITEPADKAKNIVGFNNNVALLINEKKRPNMGSVDINNKLQYKSDMGVDLTRQRGYVFNLNNYATDKKKFTGVVSYVLADLISRTEVVSECKCDLDQGVYPNTKCVAKEIQLLAPKKGTAKGR
ncbi:hypothetical protein PVAND_014440 [Polypedilum vanderplanki]|uniref:Apolipophorin n=1 Tax=Polypedilum vanderplanki TaxID=319348 RepID=A0A9J6BA72_POLVA|nr:hypothetical protein PVAND_014440 [Polypedilum vanderplanki]